MTALAPNVVPRKCVDGMVVKTVVSPATGDKTVAASQTSTISTNPAIGVVVEILGKTDGQNWCNVLTYGETPPIFTGLTGGQVYYAGDDGALATSGTQRIGIASNSEQLFVQPD